MNKTLTDLAHEIYAAAQTAPGEGIEDATGRIEALLAAQQPEPIAWESTTVGYTKYITDERYQKFSHEVRKWYKPYRCSACMEPRAEVTDDDVAKLKRFAGLVLKDHRNGGYPGDVDGDVIQGYAEDCGLIEERQMSEPCSEGCSCSDFDEFPTVCYFNTDLGKAAINAARAGEGHADQA
ncbi:TPA: hypothetical protein QDB10_003245 [Burkholderia vietnamiensis]|nr:hypothetical protein [Burkholderia vietnamiensis]